MLQRHYRLLLIAAIVIVGLFTLNAAIRGFVHARRLRGGADQPIQAWMNVPYISHAYHVPPQVIAQAIGLSPEQRDRRPIREIALDQGRLPSELIADIEAAIARVRAPGPPPEEPPPPVPPQRLAPDQPRQP